jgi:hypothetical protein
MTRPVTTQSILNSLADATSKRVMHSKPGGQPAALRALRPVLPRFFQQQSVHEHERESDYVQTIIYRHHPRPAAS